MADKKLFKEGMLSGLTTKQKVIIIGLIVVVIVVVWQMIGLFSGGGTSASQANFAAGPKMPMSANAPGKPLTPINPGNPNPNVPPMPVSPPSPAIPNQPNLPTNESVSMKEAPVSMDARLVDLQKEIEQKYIDQLNQLQTLKIQREIAETNQAIAAAKLATVTAEKNASDLLTRPSTPTPPTVPASAYSGTLVNPTPTGVTVTGPETLPPPVNQPPPPEVAQYVVISVSMQLGRWSAVLGYQGKLFNVSIGDVLPVDGSVVASINKNGVVLVKGHLHKRISIVSSI